MLKKLLVQNYALIEQLVFEPGQRLNIITGETGAGKSILLGALGLILGERADSYAVSKKGSKCIVEAEFTINNHLISFFEKHELDFDTTCIVRREVTDQGKSRAFINDTPVNLSVLRDLSLKLVDIHSQHETLELNAREFQMEVLDTMAGNASQLYTYKEIYQRERSLHKILHELKQKRIEADKEQEYIQYLFNELNEAKLQAGEQQAMEEELNILVHAEEGREQSIEAFQIISGDEAALLDQLASIKAKLVVVGKNNPAFVLLAERIESCLIELKDIAAELEGFSEQLAADPARVEEINQRLKLIYHLQTKHRANTLDGLLEEESKLAEKLLLSSNMEDEINKIEKELAKLKAELLAQGNMLTQRRSKAIPSIEKSLNQMLKEVGLERATLEVKQTAREAAGIDGFEDISILFSANKGSIPIPIQKAASGGELSRVMLCIKTLIADKIELPTLIFDEIDTGISGETAIKVGNMMKKLSASHQLIAITHLPQIAGKADEHFQVYKEEKGGNTLTSMTRLAEEDQVKEVARMLGGAQYTDTALMAARELKTI
jgi:DNA repair protein RecN (Recombination protein N)